MLATLLPNILRVGYFVKTARHLVWCSWLSNESEHHDKIYRRASGLQIEDWNNAWVRYVILKALAICNNEFKRSVIMPWSEVLKDETMKARLSFTTEYDNQDFRNHFLCTMCLHIMCQKQSYWEDRFVKPDTAFQDRTSYQLWNWAGRVMVW